MPGKANLQVRPAENAKDVVLRARQPCRLQELFRFLAEGIGGLQERHKNAGPQGSGGRAALERETIVEYSRYNDYCQEESTAPSRPLMISVADEGQSRSGSFAGLRDDGFNGVATSSGLNAREASFAPRLENSVATLPGQITLTRCRAPGDLPPCSRKADYAPFGRAVDPAAAKVFFPAGN